MACLQSTPTGARSAATALGPFRFPQGLRLGSHSAVLHNGHDVPAVPCCRALAERAAGAKRHALSRYLQQQLDHWKLARLDDVQQVLQLRCVHSAAAC